MAGDKIEWCHLWRLNSGLLDARSSHWMQVVKNSFEPQWHRYCRFKTSQGSDLEWKPSFGRMVSMSLLENQSYYFIIALGTWGELLLDASSRFLGFPSLKYDLASQGIVLTRLCLALGPRVRLRDTTRKLQSLLATVLVPSRHWQYIIPWRHTTSPFEVPWKNLS